MSQIISAASSAKAHSQAQRAIRKVAVLGSGVMGSRIACHFANIGCEVILLDIVPFELTEKEQAKGLSKEHPQVRNRIVNDALKAAVKSKPAPLYRKSFADRIRTGNFDDDLGLISDCDWVIEAVIERLDIKKDLYERVEKHRKPGTLITSNTSGIPMQHLIEGRSEDFRENFCGVHFFNPPRYLRLLEIIPAPDTASEVIDFLMHYGDLYLGKKTVLCKDTPAFIANRVGIFGIMSSLHTVAELGLGVAEVDKLTGPVIGRAKSATFRTLDVVGLDTAIKVSKGLYHNLPEDESRDTFKLPEMVSVLEETNRLGDKTGQGFYKKTKNEQGKKVILELDLSSYEYREQNKTKFEILKKARGIDSLKERIPVLVNSEGKAGEFYRKTFFDMFRYVSFRIPEISDETYRIDDAVCSGFGWKLGPFETWDTLGVADTVKKMEEAGAKPAQWIYDMLESGAESFYIVEKGIRKFYDVETKSYKAVPGAESFIILDNIRENQKVWGNDGTTVFDLGDGILGLEFHTKMNSIGSEVIEGINTAVSMAEKNYRGLVIGNDGDNFSAGANLAMLYMFALEQEYDEIEMVIRQFQNTIMRARYSSVPVVVATAGMALGGGCELTMHADAVQAHTETYIGLVEFGVGLIPGGGGTKETVLRVSDSFTKDDSELNRLSEAFLNIGTAKVATSAHEAKDMNIFSEKDRFTLNRSRLLVDAKARAVELAEAGYTQKPQRKDIKVLGKNALASLIAGTTGMKYGRFISEHDLLIAKKLAYVMTGGDLSAPSLVSEQYLLDLEREAFVSLCGEQKTLDRINSILTKGKPLRN